MMQDYTNVVFELYTFAMIAMLVPWKEGSVLGANKSAASSVLRPYLLRWPVGLVHSSLREISSERIVEKQ